jgi:predicted nucleic acid-binding protein
MNAIDTNILIYGHDTRDLYKQRLALELIDSLEDGALLWQVACEYVAASRKLAKFGYDVAAACQDIRHLKATWLPVLPSWSDYARALDLSASMRISIWDALIVCSCATAGVRRLYFEDLVWEGSIEGVELLNPFDSPAQPAIL